MRQGNRQFVRNIIIASVLGAFLLMLVLFMFLQSFFNNGHNDVYANGPVSSEQMDSKVELSETMLVLVHKISDKSVEGYDIKNRRTISKQLSDLTRVNDAYGNTIPVNEIRPGDIVEVECEQGKQQVYAVSRSGKSQSWKKISGIIINADQNTVSIGGTDYAYNSNTMFVKSDGTDESPQNISPYDIVTVQGYEDNIWSIKVEEMAASIKVQDLPTDKGSIEIDYARIVNFAEITEPVKVIPGKHKLVIRMQGYEVMTPELNVSAGEVYELSLKTAEKAYTPVEVKMFTDVSDYTIKIGDKTFKPGEQIKLEQGKYKVSITADGYKEWRKNILLEKDPYVLRVSLTPIEEEKDQEDDQTQNNEALANSRTVTLSTDPDGAKVYVDGALGGQSPYTVTLTNGSHTILFEKDGYEVYSTSIQIDSSNDQTSYLYVLTKR